MNLKDLIVKYNMYVTYDDKICYKNATKNEVQFLKSEVERLGRKNVVQLIREIMREEIERKKQLEKEKMLNELKEKTQCNYDSMYCFGLDELYSKGLQREVFEQLSEENLVEIKNEGDYITKYNVNVNGTELLERMEKLQNEANKKSEETKSQNEQELEKLKIQAKTTGKKVFYKKEIGYDKNEDCEVDINYYVMSNGEITIEKILSY